MGAMVALAAGEVLAGYAALNNSGLMAIGAGALGLIALFLAMMQGFEER